MSLICREEYFLKKGSSFRKFPSFKIIVKGFFIFPNALSRETFCLSAIFLLEYPVPGKIVVMYLRS
jgi:hypothetical protein